MTKEVVSDLFNNPLNSIAYNSNDWIKRIKDEIFMDISLIGE